MKATMPNLIYHRCMRRLQANLAYLAAVADRSHKPSAQIPPHPAFISAPPLVPLTQKSAKPPNSTTPAPSKIKTESTTAANGITADTEESEDRAITIRSLYTRLQALF